MRQTRVAIVRERLFQKSKWQTRETYKVMLESEAEMSELIGEVEDEL